MQHPVCPLTSLCSRVGSWVTLILCCPCLSLTSTGGVTTLAPWVGHWHSGWQPQQSLSAPKQLRHPTTECTAAQPTGCWDGLHGLQVYHTGACRPPVCSLIAFDGSVAVPALPHPGHGCFHAASEEVGLVDNWCRDHLACKAGAIDHLPCFPHAHSEPVAAGTIAVSTLNEFVGPTQEEDGFK